MKVRYKANEVQTKPLPLQEQLGGMMGEKRNMDTGELSVVVHGL